MPSGGRMLFGAVVVALALGGATPAAAQQFDMSGLWSSTLGNREEVVLRSDPGVESFEYVGIPLNEAARLHADTWVPGMHSLIEWQARPHPATYSIRAPRPDMRIAPVIDPETQQPIGYTMENMFGRADRIVWVDGRPHPSKYAQHLWQGFSTGVWENGYFKVTTTHLKYSFIHRNGIPLSPYAVMTEYFWRRGDLLIASIVLDDPIYLDEPMIRTSTWLLDPTMTIAPARPFEVFDEIAAFERGDVPHNPMGHEDHHFAEVNNLPYRATRGGAESMYPEYQEQIRNWMAEEGLTPFGPSMEN
jgi:hypothetical protein